MKLEEVLKICDSFIKNPDDKDVVSAYNDMISQLVIRDYLPIQEKVISLVRLILDSDKDIDVPATFFTAGLELACCFDGLLSYTNIEQTFDISVKNYENYDIIYQSGLADYILRYCGKDYDRLVRMMERTLSYENLTELIKSIHSIDTGNLKEVTDEIRKIEKDADPEVIKNLADIMRLNDPNLNNLKNKIDKDSVIKSFDVDKIVTSKNN